MIRNKLYYFYLNNKDGSEKEDEELKLKQLASWTTKDEGSNTQGLNYMSDTFFDDEDYMSTYFFEDTISITIKGVTINITKNYVSIKQDKDNSMPVFLD